MRSRKLRVRTMLDQQVDPVFSKVSECVSRERSITYRIRDILMAGLAVFMFKYPSLLEFEEDSRRKPSLTHNLRNLFRVHRAPSDETMRQRLDKVPPKRIERVFKKLFAVAQRAKVLQKRFQVVDDCYLLAIDGTGVYSSRKVSCESCCERAHGNGRVEYHHQMVLGALVHPAHGHTLIPTAPEFVSRSDGTTKNDCERNALKRYLPRFRREHPHLKTIVVMDALHANEPMVRLLREHGLHYVIVVKESDHERLFRQFRAHCRGEVDDDVRADGSATGRKVSYGWRLPTAKRGNAERVNMVVTQETPVGRESLSEWAYITDLPASKHTAAAISALGRARWRIENEVYRTLKTMTGLEHNHGHGKQHLMTNFILLMLMAFMLDQLQALGSEEFRAALAKESNRPSYLWKAMRGALDWLLLDDWTTLYGVISEDLSVTVTRESLSDPPA